ncbi:urea ABC transporter permease subunit UrtB, partial [bacterium]
TLLATFAISIIIKQGVRLFAGAELKLVGIPYNGNIRLGDVSIPHYHLFIIAMTILATLITWFIFQKTSFGKKSRATTQNRGMTECLGIDTSSVDTWTFAHGMGLAGLAGAVIAPISSVSPFMGTSYLTDTFMNVVVGGVSSLVGTALSSLMIGESVSVLSGISNEISAKILVFLIVIVIIRFKPEGLFALERR